MKTVFQSILCLLLAQSLFSQNFKKIEVGNFTSIGNSIAADITVKKGNTCEVEISATTEYMNKIEFVVEKNRLLIRHKKKNNFWGDNGKAKINITMPSLEGISSAGSGDIDVVSEFDANEFSISSAGSGSISVKGGNFETIKVSSAGSGDITCKGGKATIGTISSAGSGDINTSGMSMETVKCSSAGSGEVSCWATKELKASSVGSGDIRYKGSPNVKSNSLGSGSVHAIN